MVQQVKNESNSQRGLKFQVGPLQPLIKEVIPPLPNANAFLEHEGDECFLKTSGYQ